MSSTYVHHDQVSAQLTPYVGTTYQLIAEGKRAAISLRHRLQLAGYNGWTETKSTGYWQGRPTGEQFTFEVFVAAAPDDTGGDLDLLADALVDAHRHDQPNGVFQLVSIDPHGLRILHEVRGEITERTAA